ncbi:MAG: DUF4388 domain-containing protein [Candidatus Eisenbacteria bacterium]|nr:DUF4388 domain-containing protein [Candidatus Eisenbacteria bacterium]
MAPVPALGGELGLLSLFDLGQLLLLNGATGELCVTREGRKGYLYFDRGQIVNAVDDEYHEGEGAAYTLFSWKSGTFEFHARPARGVRVVTEGTEALMLEAARRMDELGLGEAGEEAKLKQRASALDALREAFHSVAVESGAGASESDGAPGSPLARLAGPDDVLLLRPGRRTRVRMNGAWQDAGAAPLDPSAYEQLRVRLQDVTAGAKESARVHLTAGEDGRRYATARLAGEHEALWVRLADAPSPALASLPGGEVIAAQIAGASGLLLVAAPEPGAAGRFFHACVAHLAASRGEALLLVAEAGRAPAGDGTGAVLRAGSRDAEAVLRSCAPGCAAFDAAHAHLSSAALGLSSLVVAGIVAPGPEAAVPAWCARNGRRAGDGIEELLARLGASVAFASSTDSTARLVLTRAEAPAAPAVHRSPAKRAA